MAYQNKIDQKLEVRSNLTFVFPETQGRKRVVLPFYENIKITEQGKANYASYQPISRAGTLFTYLGAESRKFNVSFNLTLPHLLEAHNYNYNNPNLGPQSAEAKKNEFFQDLEGNFDGVKIHQGYAQQTSLFDTEYASLVNSDINQLLVDGMTQVQKKILGAVGFSTLQAGGLAETAGGALKNAGGGIKTAVNSGVSGRQKAIDLLAYWVDIIRVSVANNVDNPSEGPPIVEINNGILYQSVPCICANFNISHDEMAGYDAKTLLPRKINVTMNLIEYRLHKRSKSAVKHGDDGPSRLKGWEVVIGSPYNIGNKVQQGNSSNIVKGS